MTPTASYCRYDILVVIQAQNMLEMRSQILLLILNGEYSYLIQIEDFK